MRKVKAESSNQREKGIFQYTLKRLKLSEKL
jgi:hypothetical protein